MLLLKSINCKKFGRPCVGEMKTKHCIINLTQLRALRR